MSTLSEAYLHVPKWDTSGLEKMASAIASYQATGQELAEQARLLIETHTSIFDRIEEAWSIPDSKYKALFEECDLAKQFSEAFKPTQAYIDAITDFSALHSIMPSFSDGIQRMLFEAELQQATINEQLSGSFGKITENFGFCRRNLELLGTYGWTIDWNAPVGVYLHTPSNIEAEDARLSKYFTRENVDDIIDSIQKTTHDRVSKEAIMTFRRGCYHACALLLFSAIEREIIRYTHAPDALNHVYGSKAITKFEGQIANDLTNGSLKASASIGTIIALTELWKPATNFCETTIINRNNLLHGMFHREVTRLDCIKLLLVYNNVLWITAGFKH